MTLGKLAKSIKHKVFGPPFKSTERGRKSSELFQKKVAGERENATVTLRLHLSSDDTREIETTAYCTSDKAEALQLAMTFVDEQLDFIRGSRCEKYSDAQNVKLSFLTLKGKMRFVIYDASHEEFEGTFEKFNADVLSAIDTGNFKEYTKALERLKSFISQKSDETPRNSPDDVDSSSLTNADSSGSEVFFEESEKEVILKRTPKDSRQTEKNGGDVPFDREFSNSIPDETVEQLLAEIELGNDNAHFVGDDEVIVGSSAKVIKNSEFADDSEGIYDNSILNGVSFPKLPTPPQEKGRKGGRGSEGVEAVLPVAGRRTTFLDSAETIGAGYRVGKRSDNDDKELLAATEKGLEVAGERLQREQAHLTEQEEHRVPPLPTRGKDEQNQEAADGLFGVNATGRKENKESKKPKARSAGKAVTNNWLFGKKTKNPLDRANDEIRSDLLRGLDAHNEMVPVPGRSKKDIASDVGRYAKLFQEEVRQHNSNRVVLENIIKLFEMAYQGLLGKIGDDDPSKSIFRSERKTLMTIIEEFDESREYSRILEKLPLYSGLLEKYAKNIAGAVHRKPKKKN